MTGRKFYPGDRGFLAAVAGITLVALLVFGLAFALIIAVVWKLFAISVWWGIAGILAFVFRPRINVNR